VISRFLPGERIENSYQSMVESTLHFLIEQVGEVEGAYPDAGRLARLPELAAAPSIRHGILTWRVICPLASQ
jgi:hypothetical protein